MKSSFHHISFTLFILSSLLFSSSSYAYFEATNSTTGSKGTGNTALEACKKVTNASTASNTFCYEGGTGTRILGVYKEIKSCLPTVKTNPISIPGWTEWTLDQIDQYQNKISSSTVCYQGCRYKDPAMTGEEGSDLMALQYANPTQDTSCPNTSENPPTIPPDNYEPPQTDCKNSAGSDSYCTKPSTGCPTGYSSGTYNGQQICIKNSNTNPNPNDPNNQTDPPDPKPNTGDMSGVINAINNAKNELKAAIQAQTNALTASIEQQTTDIKQSISAQTSALTNAINASTNSIKESLTTGFKNVTDAIGLTNSRIDQTNQKLDDANIKLNDIKSSNNQIRDNINVTNQKLEDVKQNQQQTNSKLDDIKKNTADTNKALSDIKSNGDQVKEGIDQANGHLSSIDANGKATNQKLDGLKDGQDETNGLLKGIKDLISDIKNWLTEEPDVSGLQQDLPEREIEQRSIVTTLFTSSAQCPPDNTLYLMGMSYTYSFADLCYYLRMLGYLIMTVAYLYAARIVSQA
ncbi:Chromosome partition protein Smc [Acinetobacter venetianus]|uniref:Chromosome partition protein Smc n=1 Tax=Acinetobacter venetianus TaxID=52133 RepID=A0A150HN22_9GAMM|nr:virulence factor TspB C-terminal domain-related protein [Acinetobacter venetianus]KXZ67579.1 Chromosome partition protein Smc [Acinetobacter venetianus]